MKAFFYLFVAKGRNRGRRYLCPAKEIICLGRSDRETNDIMVEDNYVSSRHMLLEQKKNRMSLIDLKSKNGSFVNGNRVTPFERIPLCHMDKIQAGTMTLYLLWGKKIHVSGFLHYHKNSHIASFPLQEGKLTLGRESRNCLCFQDNTISSFHARIVRTANDFHIEDLGSTNGTKVNHIPVLPDTPHPLHHNDIIELGGTRMHFTEQITEADPARKWQFWTAWYNNGSALGYSVRKADAGRFAGA